MKKIILALFAIVLLAGSANAQSKKRTIDPENLPKAANELIQKHWPSCAIDFAYVKGKEYEALLTDGTIIQFDSKGVWKEMKCTEGLPVTLVPVYITRYIVNRYPKQLIIDCEKLGDYVMNVVESRLGKRYLRFKGLQVNIDKKTVIADDVVVSLTRIEFELLCLLLSNKGQVFSRSQLMNSIWQGVIVTDRTVDVNMTRLRKKLGPYAQHIANRQGYGYFFDDSI